MHVINVLNNCKTHIIASYMDKCGTMISYLYNSEAKCELRSYGIIEDFEFYLNPNKHCEILRMQISALTFK